jgi:hypothetical protein
MLLIMISLLGLAGCATGRVIPETVGGGSGSGPTAPTPSGTYALTVSGTSAGLSRTVELTLIVQ